MEEILIIVREMEANQQAGALGCLLLRHYATRLRRACQPDQARISKGPTQDEQEKGEEGGSFPDRP